MTYVCWNIHQRGHQSQCQEVNVTAVCNKQGHWEPDTDHICAEPTGTCDYDLTIIAIACNICYSMLVSWHNCYRCLIKSNCCGIISDNLHCYLNCVFHFWILVLSLS